MITTDTFIIISSITSVIGVIGGTVWFIIWYGFNHPYERPKFILAVFLTSIITILIVGLLSGAILFIPRLISSSTRTQAAMPPTYSAFIPGPGCDLGGGEWSINQSSPPAHMRCSSSGMVITQPARVEFSSTIEFKWPGHVYPHNYTIDVTISNLAINSCAEVMTRWVRVHAYDFFICSPVAWGIILNGARKPLLYLGELATKAPYHLHIVMLENSEEISINGGQLYTVVDSTYQYTNAIGFFVGGLSNSPTWSATFSSFVYTPML